MYFEQHVRNQKYYTSVGEGKECNNTAVKTDRNSCGMESRGFLAAARLSCCPMQWHRRGDLWTFRSFVNVGANRPEGETSWGRNVQGRTDEGAKRPVTAEA